MFLSFRLCFKTKIHPEEFSSLKMRDPQKETVDALIKLINPFVNFAVPLITTVCLETLTLYAPAENAVFSEQFYLMLLTSGF